MKLLLFTGGAGGGRGGGGGGRPFTYNSQPWRYPTYPNFPNNGRRRRSLDNICGELRRQFAQSNNNPDNVGNTNANPSQVSSLLESMKNFPLHLPNAPGNNAFGNLPNLNSNPSQTPNFPDSKSVDSFENTNSNLLSPTFSGSNNVDGDNALFGGGNNLDDVKNDLRNSMGNAFEGQDAVENDENVLNSNGLANDMDPSKGNTYNQFKDNADQKDGPMNNPFLSDFDGGSKQFDQSRLYESGDDLWNLGQYDSTSNYDFPSSYYDSGDASNSWMMEDYNGYRRLVVHGMG